MPQNSHCYVLDPTLDLLIMDYESIREAIRTIHDRDLISALVELRERRHRENQEG